MKGTAFDLQRTGFKAGFRKFHRQPQTQLATRLAARLDVREKETEICWHIRRSLQEVVLV